MDRKTMNDNTTDDDDSPRARLEADLEIPGVRTLFGKERERVLTLPQAGTVSEFCGRAVIRCRVTGGPEVRVVLWDGPDHGVTQSTDYRTVYAVDQRKLPPDDPERSLRILEVLAYGCFNYAARESVCGRGYFVAPGGAASGDGENLRKQSL
jgi:hypothetical protein